AGASWRRIVSTSGSSGTHVGSSTRVRLEVDVLEPLARGVGVELGGRDVGVPEHLLYRAQVAAAGQQMGGERVTQRVRAHLAVKSGGARVALDVLVEALAGRPPPALVDEQPPLVAQADERGPAP